MLRILWLLAIFAVAAGAASSRSDAQPIVTIQDCSGPKAIFKFGNYLSYPGNPPYPRLSDSARDKFVETFCKEVANVKQWYVGQGWGSSPALPDLNIDVDDKNKTSGSLVHMALGEDGQMDFPAPEVVIGKTAIAHELTHVVLPNGNRLLAEGLAVYVQQAIGKNEAFPNFGRPLHRIVRGLSCGMNLVGVPRPSLDEIEFTDADRIATPSPVTLRIGLIPYDSPASQGYVYVIVGSFVQFLIERHGMKKFRDLYNLTLLIAGQRNEGPPDRWAKVYGATLTGLARDWRAHLAVSPCPH
jgi:hypothetical protein